MSSEPRPPAYVLQDEGGGNRNNNNRLMDTQNNAKGGYGYGGSADNKVRSRTPQPPPACPLGLAVAACIPPPLRMLTTSTTSLRRQCR